MDWLPRRSRSDHNVYGRRNLRTRVPMKYWHTVEQVTAEAYTPELNRHPTNAAIHAEVYRSDAGPNLAKVAAELAAIRSEKAEAQTKDDRAFASELFLALVPDLIRTAKKITRRNQKKVTMKNKLLGERILNLED